MTQVAISIGHADGTSDELSLVDGTYSLGGPGSHLVLRDPNATPVQGYVYVSGGTATLYHGTSGPGWFDADAKPLQAPHTLRPGEVARLGWCTLQVKQAAAHVHAPVQHGHAGAAHHHHEEHGLLHPVLWPFRSKQEWPRMWWLLLIDYIPVVNLIVMRGWRLEVVRRMARGEQPITPHFQSILKFFGNGLLLWTMTALYALLPLVIIAQLGVGGFKDFVGDLVEFSKILLGQSDQSLAEFARNELIDSLLEVLIELAWIPLSSPLYRAAMIRFAVTSDIASFGNFPATIGFIFRHFGAFVKLYLFSFLLGIAVAMLGGFLVITGVGAIVVPLVTVPLYYWSTAFEYGELAQKLAKERAERGINKPAPSIGRQALVAAALVVTVAVVAVRSVTNTLTAATDHFSTVAAGFASGAERNTTPRDERPPSVAAGMLPGRPNASDNRSPKAAKEERPASESGRSQESQ